MIILLLAACGGDSSTPAPGGDQGGDETGGSGGSGGPATGGRGGGAGRPGGGGGATSQPDASASGGRGGAVDAGGGGAGGSSRPDAGADARVTDGAPSPDGAGTGGTGGAPAVSGTPFVYVSGYSTEIGIFKLDPAAGTLAPSGTVSGGQNASYMAFSPNKKFLYALHGGSGIRSFSVNPATGALTQIGSIASTSPGQGPPHIAVHPSGKWIGTSFWEPVGYFVINQVKEDGSAGAVVSSDAPTENGRMLREAHQVVFSPDGNHAFVPHRGPNRVAQYKFDAATGKLSRNTPFLVTPPTIMAPGLQPNSECPGVEGPRHMAFHPNGKWAYVLTECRGGIVSYNYDAATGTLSGGEALPSGAPNEPENWAAHVVVHPNGQFVYVSNRRTKSLGIFAVNATTGRLTLVGHEKGGGQLGEARDFAVDPAGKVLVSADQSGAGAVHVFKILADGKLMKVGAPIQIGPQPVFVGITYLP